MQKNLSLVIAFAAFGVLIGWFSHGAAGIAPDPAATNSYQERHAGTNKLTNPLLECDAAEALTHALKPFKSKISDFIQSEINYGHIDMASVYFRDLNNGPWFGVNQSADFAPASLLKVPIMLAAFKKAETDPALLQKKVLFHEKTDANAEEVFKPKKAIENGKEYTIEQLIEYMIVYSDNNAKDLLLKNFDPDGTLSTKVLADVGIVFPDNGATSNFITVRDYASFFRVLFNASYLNQQMSERALEMLVKSTFDPGLDAGIPKGIPIADKFGERELPNQSQLHDCGIVYYPDHPYLICVMTRGSNLTFLENTIAQIARISYQEVSSQVHQQ